MGLSLKNIDRVCLGVIVLTVLVLGYFVIKQGYGQERVYRQEKARVTKTMQDLRVTEANIQQLTAWTKTTAEALGQINRQIPEQADLGEFIKQLDNITKKRGIDLISVRPQAITKEKLYQKLPVQLSCKGSFDSLFRFLQDVEHMDRLAVMEKLVIGKAAPGFCQLDVTILLFAREPLASPRVKS